MKAVTILFIVFALIAVRQIGKIRLQIWSIMLLGAIASIVTKNITVVDAVKSVNIDIVMFLFGMFVVGQALEESGYLSYLSYKVFRKAKSADALLIFILFGMGIASAVLTNDTLAIIGTPVILILAKKHRISAKPLLLALAFAITIGSVMSPIGNPQNLLIALNGNISNPFFTFLKYLFVPTIINLLLAYFVLKIFYKEEFNNNNLNHHQEPIKDLELALLSKISVLLILVLIIIKIVIVLVGLHFDFKLTYIALASSLIILLFSRKRLDILKNVDWKTLVFFASMFILMESVWDSGFFQKVINGSEFSITTLTMIFIVSILLSQLISNVPLVALYMPLLVHAGASVKEMIALAAGSTIAGNLTILGAASNIIIIQNTEEKSDETITFFEFAKIGLPLTVINALVYLVYLFIV